MATGNNSKKVDGEDYYSQIYSKTEHCKIYLYLDINK